MGCTLEGADIELNQTDENNEFDEDGDGVPNNRDACPLSPTDELVNTRGCTADQENELSIDAGQGSTDESRFMLYVLILSLVFVVGAFISFQSRKKNNLGTVEYIEAEFNEENEVDFSSQIQFEQKQWVQPVLDGSLASKVEEADRLRLSETQKQQLHGWGEDMIHEYLDQGWTVDQLIEYYQQQLEKNT